MARSNLNSIEFDAPNKSSRLRGDTLRITTMRGLRQAAYGMMAVILAIALTGAGWSAITISLLISVSLAGDLFGTLVIGRWADQWGAAAHTHCVGAADGGDRSHFRPRWAL